MTPTTKAPVELLTCLDSHVVQVEGVDYVVAKGETVRASHPAARLNPAFFAPAGLTDQELNTARRDRNLDGLGV